MDPIAPISLDAIRTARSRIHRSAVRTPLLPLPPASSEASRGGAGGRTPRIWLKLECLQPIGSFKIRGAAKALAMATEDQLRRGVYTASAGNMAQGVAFAARRRRLPCRVIVPESAPRTKVESIRRLGGTVVPLPFDEWWRVLEEHGHPEEEGLFVHPVSDPAVIAGNGTVGLEIIEELPDVAAALAPYGGGGLSCGIASALKAHRPEIRVLAAEVETAAPFAASLQAGRPASVERIPTFVDGIGGASVLEEMWPLARDLLDGSIVESIDDVCAAILRLARDVKVVAEGAGGAAVSAALRYAAEVDGPVVAVVSGGNIDTDVLATILEGGRP
ncbi:MAG: pyridoxal-phosphate dependent enzyme [Longimicrobiales bacterium]|nr:pyridoxal-phosphate dependent enzyme [Longimicrobiales bacterium]